MPLYEHCSVLECLSLDTNRGRSLNNSDIIRPINSDKRYVFSLYSNDQGDALGGKGKHRVGKRLLCFKDNSFSENFLYRYRSKFNSTQNKGPNSGTSSGAPLFKSCNSSGFESKLFS